MSKSKRVLLTMLEDSVFFGLFFAFLIGGTLAGGVAYIDNLLILLLACVLEALLILRLTFDYGYKKFGFIRILISVCAPFYAIDFFL